MTCVKSSILNMNLLERNLHSFLQRTTIEEQTDIAEDASKFSPKVIAASGDNIIAVANPALAMSPAILPVTSLSAESRESRKHDPQ